MKNKILKQIKKIFDFILENDRFSEIFKSIDFSDKLIDLLSIAKQICSNYNLKFNYLQYLLAFNIMFNIRLKINDAIQYNEHYFKKIINDYEKYFNDIFNQNNSIENIYVKRHLSYAISKWTFPICQPLTFCFKELHGKFKILSDSKINRKTFSYIKKDFIDNRYQFCNKFDWSYFLLKIIFVILRILICVFGLFIVIFSFLSNFNSPSILLLIAFSCASILTLFRTYYFMKYTTKQNNYKSYIPIELIPYKSLEFKSFISMIHHRFDIFIFLFIFISFTTYFFVSLFKYEFNELWFIVCSIIYLVIILSYAIIFYIINNKKMKINYDLIIELYDKYYYEIFNEMANITTTNNA